MDYCVHGFLRENCPHCKASIGVKPVTRLVKPAPREIPLPIPQKKDLDKSPKEELTPAFSPDKTRHPSLKVTRSFNLHNSVGKSTPCLFTQSRTKLRDRYDRKDDLHEKDVKVKLEKIERQFTRSSK